jgi:hypothetical protein
VGRSRLLPAGQTYSRSKADGTRSGTPLGANCSGVGIGRAFRTGLRTLRDFLTAARFTDFRARVFLIFFFDVFADAFAFFAPAFFAFRFAFFAITFSLIDPRQALPVSSII